MLLNYVIMNIAWGRNGFDGGRVSRKASRGRLLPRKIIGQKRELPKKITL
ncbi:hypothetical protein X274_08675 [Marinitoga sp. 1155]|nr:hypothetical protein X274_08675 [Marinitoga sp. 1155]